jgi:PITH domain
MDAPECSGHSHDHNGHDVDGVGKSLRSFIDFDRVICYNEEVDGSGKLVLKVYENRLSTSPMVYSPQGDAELLFHIPFTEAVTIQSICIRDAHDVQQAGGHGDILSSPRHVKIFVDRNDLDFESARELPPALQLELLPPDHHAEATIDYPVRPASKFSYISSIQIYVMTNYSSIDGQDTENDECCGTAITYVGFKGSGTNVRRRAVQAVYESYGMPEDHQVPGATFGARPDVS